MPLIRPFFTSSAPLALALAVQADATALLLWAKSQGRFPERDVAALPAHRQLEHYAVDVVLKRMGWEAHQMQIVHDAQLKPIIQSEDVGMAQQAIAIAHSTEESLCHALVTIGSGAIGCDIEGEREALRTVAHRVLSPDEGTAESSLSRLSALWTVKESMFKAFGPGLDFRRDLRVALPTTWDPESASFWTIEGHVQSRRFHWKVSAQRSPSNGARIWLCCGPLEAEFV